MIKKIVFLFFALTGVITVFAQTPPTGTPPTTAGGFFGVTARANAAWYRGGNTFFGPGANNIFGFVGGINSSIWYQTNGFNRMMMMNGGSTNLDGRIAIGENILTGFVPQSRLHLNHNSFSAIDMRFTNFTTGSGAGDGLQIGINGLGEAGLLYHENFYMSFATDGIRRMSISNTSGLFPGATIIGNNVPVGFVPQSMLHINNSGAAPTDLRFTNLSSGTGFLDGFRIGLNPLANIARLAMLETGEMRFSTSNTDWVTILSNGFTGINTMVPTDRLEINSGLNCTSGLTFTQLNSLCPTVPNPGPGVLSVDGSGRVIYVGGSSLSAQMGDDCTISTFPGTNGLSTSRFLSLNNNNFYFPDAPGNTGSLYIGANNNCGPIISRLDVINDTKNVAGYFLTRLNSSAGIAGLNGESFNVGTGTSVGLSGRGSSLGGTAIGVNAVSLGGSTSSGTFSIGLNASSFNPTGVTTQVIGVNGQSRNGLTYSISGNFDVLNSSSPQNYGINVEVIGNTNPAVNYGGYFFVNGNAPGSINYGVYSDCGPSSGNTPPTGPNYAGYFNGDVIITGTYNWTSDEKLKKNIKDVNNALDLIGKLQPKTFEFDKTVNPGINLPNNTQYGFIAQQVETVIPEFVNPIKHPARYDSTGTMISKSEDYKGVNYLGFIALMMQGIKEQQKMIEDQQKQIDELKAVYQGGTNDPNKINIELSDKDVIILDQNVPNPFAEQTVINFNLPLNVGKAQLLFYNAEGKLINSQDLTQRGKGQVTVFANDLSNGIYSYVLVVDGKIVETRKMVKAK